MDDKNIFSLKDMKEQNDQQVQKRFLNDGSEIVKFLFNRNK